MGISNGSTHRRSVIAALTGAMAAAGAAQVTTPPGSGPDLGDDPAGFWSPERMRDARPLPLPAPSEPVPPEVAPESGDSTPDGSPSGAPDASELEHDGGAPARSP